MYIFIKFFNKIDFQYFITFLSLLTIAFFFLFIAIKSTHLPSWIKKSTAFIAFAIMVELLLFQNPLLFKISTKYLKAADIGWRQSGALKKEVLRFKNVIKANYLAVGSSQTGAVYGSFSLKNPEVLSRFAIAGMGPLDLYLYKELIKKSCNGTILLMLSDFDLREPSLIGAKLSPPQRLKILLEIVNMLSQEKNIQFSEVQDFIIANTISAYRYQYIFKGFLMHFSNRNLAFPETDITAKSIQPDLFSQLRELESIDTKWFQINLSFLDKFLSWTKTNGLDVIIIQGHYHPQALKTTHARYEYAADLFSKLADKYSHTRFIRINKIHEFSEQDYRDTLHVYPEAGYRFTEKLMRFIQNQ
ncbi:MAG: hypothetical protein ABIK15_12960 [Pseudomonadota bacterium]